MRPGAIALYEDALRGRVAPLVLRTADGRTLPFPISRWCGPPDAADEELLGHCCGPVLDVGCGPGRLTIALTERGTPALGVDISRAAVARVRQAGAPALRRSVFDPLPGQGRWATVLLADGNIGIGGLPARLLRRCSQLLAPGGRLLVETEPGDVDEEMIAWLEQPGGQRGPAFPWARVGAVAFLRAAATAGLHVMGQWRHADRVFVCAGTPTAPACEGTRLPDSLWRWSPEAPSDQHRQPWNLARSGLRGGDQLVEDRRQAVQLDQVSGGQLAEDAIALGHLSPPKPRGTVPPWSQERPIPAWSRLAAGRSDDLTAG